MISTQHALRPLAVECDTDSAVVFELKNLWNHLRRGEWVFSDTFSTSERCYAVMRAPAHPRALNPHKLDLLETILLGKPAKVIAFERRRSLSSITTATQDSLRAMGIGCRASHASVLLTMAATALLRDDMASQHGRVSQLELDDEDYTVISARRPDLQFPVALSSAEAAVLRGLIAGNSHAEISGERARSRRTVANQLATAFRKLGVSGRRATIERLIQHSAQLG